MYQDPTTVRGYNPQQNTGRMNTLPYQPAQPAEEQSFMDKAKAIWAQLDPAAVALLAAAIAGGIYALYTTIALGHISQLIAHVIVIWLTVAVNILALFSYKHEIKLVAAVGYVIAMLLFLNFFYWLIPSCALSAWAWWKSRQ